MQDELIENQRVAQLQLRDRRLAGGVGKRIVAATIAPCQHWHAAHDHVRARHDFQRRQIAADGFEGNPHIDHRSRDLEDRGAVGIGVPADSLAHTQVPSK